MAPEKWRAGVLETEMHAAALGERMRKMFAADEKPEGMVFLSQENIDTWRRLNLKGKFEMIHAWIDKRGIEVLFVDTANDFFRGRHNPSDERVVGEFFDLMHSLPLKARILVRHDRKKKEHDSGMQSNELIRGSAEWKEDPDVILYLKRANKRTNEVQMEVGKLRYGIKPSALQLWFDARCFRLTPLPPVIAVLETGVKTREELLAECQERFGLEQRSVDEKVAQAREFLIEGQQGHKRTLQIDLERKDKAPWAQILELTSNSSRSGESELHETASRAMPASSAPTEAHGV